MRKDTDESTKVTGNITDYGTAELSQDNRDISEIDGLVEAQQAHDNHALDDEKIRGSERVGFFLQAASQALQIVPLVVKGFDLATNNNQDLNQTEKNGILLVTLVASLASAAPNIVYMMKRIEVLDALKEDKKTPAQRTRLERAKLANSVAGLLLPIVTMVLTVVHYYQDIFLQDTHDSADTLTNMTNTTSISPEVGNQTDDPTGIFSNSTKVIEVFTVVRMLGYFGYEMGEKCYSVRKKTDREGLVEFSMSEAVLSGVPIPLVMTILAANIISPGTAVPAFVTASVLALSVAKSIYQGCKKDKQSNQPSFGVRGLFGDSEINDRSLETDSDCEEDPTPV